MTIAFWHWLMNYARMLCTPTHTIPNESHSGEGLRAFSIRGNCHPLSLKNSKIVSGMTYFSSAADRRILQARVPSTGSWCWNALASCSSLVNFVWPLNDSKEDQGSHRSNLNNTLLYWLFPLVSLSQLPHSKFPGSTPK